MCGLLLPGLLLRGLLLRRLLLRRLLLRRLLGWRIDVDVNLAWNVDVRAALRLALRNVDVGLTGRAGSACKPARTTEYKEQGNNDGQ